MSTKIKYGLFICLPRACKNNIAHALGENGGFLAHVMHGLSILQFKGRDIELFQVTQNNVTVDCKRF